MSDSYSDLYGDDPVAYASNGFLPRLPAADQSAAYVRLEDVKRLLQTCHSQAILHGHNEWTLYANIYSGVQGLQRYYSG